jgi:hypothetical protein
MDQQSANTGRSSRINLLPLIYYGTLSRLIGDSCRNGLWVRTGRLLTIPFVRYGVLSPSTSTYYYIKYSAVSEGDLCHWCSLQYPPASSSRPFLIQPVFYLTISWVSPRRSPRTAFFQPVTQLISFCDILCRCFLHIVVRVLV